MDLNKKVSFKQLFTEDCGCFDKMKEGAKVESSYIRLYWLAAKSIFGPKKAEVWLDENSDKLRRDITTVEEAKKEIYKFL